MKVGIITKIGKNYGALLQAYALRKMCEKNGAEAHILKYTPKISRDSYKVCKYKWRFKGTIVNIQSLLHYTDNRKSSERFLQFRDEEFNFLGDYNSYEEMKAFPPVCDVYISGSDQVWNPDISFDNAFYFSCISKENVKLASYAASIGLQSLPNELKTEFRRRVSRFDYVSVREKQAQKILAELDIKSEVAPDPTLLLDEEEWNTIACETIKEPYILCYFVSYPKGIEKVVEEVQKKYGKKCSIVNLMTSEESSRIGDVKIRDAGPREFLGLFKNASYVITSSFHGTVFSIINRKPFVTTLYKSTSSRVVELLCTLSLEDRIISPSDYNTHRMFEEQIYDKEFEKRFAALKQVGNQTIKKILE